MAECLNQILKHTECLSFCVPLLSSSVTFIFSGSLLMWGCSGGVTTTVLRIKQLKKGSEAFTMMDLWKFVPCEEQTGVACLFCHLGMFLLSP